MQLKNKVIWITGASSGIGEAVAVECARRGAALAITARRREVLEELAVKLKNLGSRVLVVPGDVTSLETLKILTANISKELGPIDILIANAGLHIPSHPENFNGAEYQMLMNLNYGGIVNSIEAVLPAMKERRSGTIVGLGSVAGYRGLPEAAAYGSSKAAINHFFESIRFHLRRLGIKVILVTPGFVKTPLTDKNDFHMPFLISSEEAANCICDGIEKEKSKITFPFIFAMFMELSRIIPYPIYEFLTERVWRRMRPV